MRTSPAATSEDEDDGCKAAAGITVEFVAVALDTCWMHTLNANVRLFISLDKFSTLYKNTYIYIYMYVCVIYIAMVCVRA